MSHEPEIARLPDWETRELLRRTLYERDEARAEAERLRGQLSGAWDEGFQARTLMAYGLAGPQRNPYLAAEAQPSNPPSQRDAGRNR